MIIKRMNVGTGLFADDQVIFGNSLGELQCSVQ